MASKVILVLFVISFVYNPSATAKSAKSVFNYVKYIRPISYDVHLFLTGHEDLRQYTGNVIIKFESLRNLFFFKLISISSINIIDAQLINLNAPQVLNHISYRITDAYGLDKAYKFKMDDTSRITNKSEIYELKIKFVRSLHQYYDKEVVIMNKYSMNNVTKYDVAYRQTDRQPLKRFIFLFRYFAFTRFQPEYIIQLIPTFEDIAFKTPIKLRITHQPVYSAISNMPIREVVTENNLVTTIFDDSPPMAAHHLAFAVGEFQSKSVEYTQNISFTLNGSPEVLVNSCDAVEISGNILYELQKYLQMPYPLPKLDYVIVPDIGYYPGVAHWGFILFKESQFYGDSIKDKTEFLMKNTILNAHLLSRQYFGNLVTPKEWQFYWLTQGLSTFFSYFILDRTFPRQNYIDQFILDNMYPTFEFYGHVHKVNSRPAYSPYWYLSDKIGARKASSILRMLQHMVGDDKFRKAIIQYVSLNAYGSTIPDDIKEAFKQSLDQSGTWPTDINIASVIENWIDNIGVPILNVTRDYVSRNIVLQQNYSGKQEDLKSQQWWIAYNYATQLNSDFENTKPMGWMKGLSNIKFDLNLAPTQWIIFNKQYTNLYVVNYDEQNWNLIINELVFGDFERIHILNRAQIINDLNQLVKWGILDRKCLIKSLFYLRRETNFLPWATADIVLEEFWKLVQSTKNVPKFKEFIRNITGTGYDHFRLSIRPNESKGQLLTRSILVKWACWAEYPNCLHDMESLSFAYMNSLNKTHSIYLHPNLKDDLFCFGFRSEANYNNMFEYFLAHPKHPDETKFFAQFGCKIDTALFRKYYFVGFHEIVSDESDYPALTKVKPQVGRWPFVINLIDIFYACLMENCYDFRQRYPKRYTYEVQYRMRMVISLCFVNENDYATIRQILEKIQNEYGDEAIEKIDKYIDERKGKRFSFDATFMVKSIRSIA